MSSQPRLRFHGLRHTFASLLIAEGLNVVYVSRQLGHADASITLGVYAHLFDRAEHARRASAALEAAFGKFVEKSEGHMRASSGDAKRSEEASLADAGRAGIGG